MQRTAEETHEKAPTPEREAGAPDGHDRRASVLDRTLCVSELESRTTEELQELARELEIAGAGRMRKQDLVFKILQTNTEQQGNIFGAGILDILEEGFGFLRQERF